MPRPLSPLRQSRTKAHKPLVTTVSTTSLPAHFERTRWIEPLFSPAQPLQLAPGTRVTRSLLLREGIWPQACPPCDMAPCSGLAVISMRVAIPRACQACVSSIVGNLALKQEGPAVAWPVFHEDVATTAWPRLSASNCSRRFFPFSDVIQSSRERLESDSIGLNIVERCAEGPSKLASRTVVEPIPTRLEFRRSFPRCKREKVAPKLPLQLAAQVKMRERVRMETREGEGSHSPRHLSLCRSFSMDGTKHPRG